MVIIIFNTIGIIYKYKEFIMQVNSINTNYYSNTKNVSQNNKPNFKAKLYTTNELTKGFCAMGGDLNWFVMNMRGLSARLKFLPDKPIMVSLSDKASNSLKSGRIPAEPAAEVFIGKPVTNNYNTVESRRIAINLNNRFLPDDIYEAAEELIK